MQNKTRLIDAGGSSNHPLNQPRSTRRGVEPRAFDNVSPVANISGALMATNDRRDPRTIRQRSRPPMLHARHEGGPMLIEIVKRASERVDGALALSPRGNSTRCQADRENVCRFAPRPCIWIKVGRREQTREFPAEKRGDTGILR